MSYVPPHMRRCNGPSPTPASLAPQFKGSLSLRSPKADWNKKHRAIVYADHAVNEWFTIGSGPDRDLLPSTEHGAATEGSVESPWSSIAKLVLPHLISSFQVLKSVDEVVDEVGVKPNLVVRFGKILSNGRCTMRVEDERSWVSESSLKSPWRMFNTNVPSAYAKGVIDVVVPKMGLETGDEKDVYHVKLSDKLRPNENISCKCRLAKKEQKLEIYKVRLNTLRHMVVDISCLEKDLDLRLMLCAKRTLKALSEEERTAITDVVGSAIIDSDVKGGLRWPLGKKSSGSNRYSVVGAWHIVSKCYQNSSLELKVREADRFDFGKSTGGATLEVNLMMRKMASALGEQNPEGESMEEMLEKSMKVIWDYFLRSPTSSSSTE